MVVRITKISQKMKKMNSLSIENDRKCFIIIIRKYVNLEKFFFFIRESIRNFSFCAYVWKVLSQQTKKVKFLIFRLCKFFKLEKIVRNFLRVGSFYFSSLESSFLKYKDNMRLEGSISWNIRNSLILELETSISWNIRNFFSMDFFYFFEIGLKSAPGSCILYY